MYKITLHGGQPVQVIGDVADPGACWVINRVGYTTNAGVVAYADRTDGALVEVVAEAPTAYAAAVRALRAPDVTVCRDAARDGAAVVGEHPSQTERQNEIARIARARGTTTELGVAT